MADNTGHEILYRYLRPTDDVEAITAMLHEAYAPLAARGMRFVASHQDSNVTRKRMSQGETIIAEDAGAIIGTITLANSDRTKGSAFYDRADVALFGQFAVRPPYQRRGIGSTLLKLVEQRATEQGVGHLVLDTSEYAVELIALYESKGYRFVEYVQWSATNYRSVILAKRLTDGQ